MLNKYRIMVFLYGLPRAKKILCCSLPLRAARGIWPPGIIIISTNTH